MKMVCLRNFQKDEAKATYRKKAIAVTTFEAGLVINNTISRLSVDEMNGLIASVAFLLCPAERHSSYVRMNRICF